MNLGWTLMLEEKNLKCSWKYFFLLSFNLLKKVIFLVARPQRGGRGKYLANKKKNCFWSIKIFPKNLATKLEGGGGKAWVGGPLKKIFFRLLLTLLKTHTYSKLCVKFEKMSEMLILIYLLTNFKYFPRTTCTILIILEKIVLFG